MKIEEHFKYHKTKFTDLGKIKILEFKEPGTINYYIRFVFDEEVCKLYISGDLGELVATNYNNMTFDNFSDFYNNIPYFIGKIDCHSRDIYEYDYDTAIANLKEYIKDYECEEDILEDYNSIDDFIDDVMKFYSNDDGIDEHGYSICSKYISDFWEIAGSLGKKSSGIIERYMTAFKLAIQQLEVK